jgi:hypothetical protein
MTCRWLALALLLALATPAHAEPLDETRSPPDSDTHRERPEPQPHYLPSWQRTQRGYLPSYQYELERRRICGDLCDDLSRQRPEK